MDCKTCKNYQSKTYERLKQAWEERKRFREKSNKLSDESDRCWAEGDKLRGEGNRLHAIVDKCWATSNKLRAESNRLCAEGDLVFLNAVLEVHGNVVIVWDCCSCIIEGIEYK